MQKADKIEYEQRIRVIQEWLLEDWPSCDIITQINQKWSIEERQAKRYIAEARKRWVDEDKVKTDQKRRLKIQSLKKLKRSLRESLKGTPQGIQAVLAVEKVIIGLEGFKFPEKIEISGNEGKPIEQVVKVDTNVDYTLLPEEVLLAIVKARKASTDD